LERKVRPLRKNRNISEMITILDRFTTRSPDEHAVARADGHHEGMRRPGPRPLHRREREALREQGQHNPALEEGEKLPQAVAWAVDEGQEVVRVECRLEALGAIDAGLGPEGGVPVHGLQ
jgi:hypothetical protein